MSDLHQGVFHPPFKTVPAQTIEQPANQQTSIKYQVNTYPREQVNTYRQSTQYQQPLSSIPMEALYNASSHGTIPLQTGQLTFESGQENNFHTPQPGTYTNTTPSSITKPNSFSIYRDKLAAHESRRTKSRPADVRSYEASQVAAQLKRMDMQRKTRVAEVKGGRMEGVEIAAKGGKSGNPGSSVVARGGKEGKGRSESGNAGSTSRSKVSEVSLSGTAFPMY